MNGEGKENGMYTTLKYMKMKVSHIFKGEYSNILGGGGRGGEWIQLVYSK